MSDPPKAERLRAFAVHVFTAAGAVFALLALVAAAERRWSLMFVWLAAALIVDGIDGTLARLARVEQVLPMWSGVNLDFVVDFVTYVFVPAFALAWSDLLPPAVVLLTAALAVMSGALYFADLRMKLPDNSFRGFPALWNLAVFYLFCLRVEPWLAAAVVVALALMTFAPFAFVHPVRVRRWRPLTLAALAAWCALAAAALARDLDPGVFINAGLCATGLYFFLIGTLAKPRGA